MSSEKPSAETLVGTVLEGAYRIDTLIGEGGMGAVYQATHLRLGKRVAVKVMARELSANSEALARFHREAVVTSGLGHPNIVQVFDFSTTPTGEPFLVMEFLEGEDLDHRIRRTGHVSPAIVLHIIEQVSAALAATHAKGIVHRDLKPANIFLLEAAGAAGFVKVLDFGISKVRASTTKLTQATAVMGTPNYMSPEQAMGQVTEIDERTDQWALACIAWECLSGEGPFVGESIPSILFQVVHEAPAPLQPRVPSLPPQVEPVLRRALSKKKDDRFASVADFARAMRDAISGQSQAIATAGSAPHAAPPASIPNLLVPTTFTRTSGELEGLHESPGPTRSRWIWAGAASAGIVLLVGVFLLLPSSAGSKAVSPSQPRSPAHPAPPPPETPPAPPAPKPPAPECVPGQKRCLDSMAQTCGSNGQWEAPVPCDSSNPCREGECTRLRPPPLRPPRPHQHAKTGSDTPTAPPSGQTAPNCTPNFYLDAQGEKHFKPECFSNGSR